MIKKLFNLLRMPEIPQPADDRSDGQKKTKFILKLAQASNIDDAAAISAIVRQLTDLKGSDEFPYVVDLVDPDRYHSETKLISEEARKRLSTALARFLKNENPK